jgi:hypothetical protein
VRVCFGYRLEDIFWDVLSYCDRVESRIVSDWSHNNHKTFTVRLRISSGCVTHKFLKEHANPK